MAFSSAPLSVAVGVTSSPEEVRGWDVKAVAAWALTIRGIDAEDVAILLKNKITGEDLLERLSEAKLVDLCKMPGGPAGRIMGALAAIIRTETVPSASAGTF